MNTSKVEKNDLQVAESAGMSDCSCPDCGWTGFEKDVIITHPNRECYAEIEWECPECGSPGVDYTPEGGEHD